MILCLCIPIKGQQFSYVGTWTSVTGGNLYVCVDNASNLFGIYSYYGHIRGTVQGKIFQGDWYQSGLETLRDDGDCCVDNYGTLDTTLVTTTKFAGSLIPVDPAGTQALFQGDITSTTTPNPKDCFLNTVPPGASSLMGKWTALGSTYLWDICIDDTGSTVGSYEYINTRTTGVIGATIRGYTVGRCFHSDSFCQMDWFEPEGSFGGYILGLYDNQTMYTQWWSGNSWDFDFNNNNDPDLHGTETLERITTTADRCQRNQNLYFDAYPLERGVIAAIVLSCIAFVVLVIVGSVFLAKAVKEGKCKRPIKDSEELESEPNDADTENPKRRKK